jgi:L-ribulose-5-phosphate 3-epimerase
VENFPDWRSPFILSADVNRAVAELPQLRVTYDNGNVTTGGESAYDGFKNSAAYIVHAHFKDFVQCAEGAPGAMRGLDGKFRRATLVGDGDVDQLGGLRAMKECNYTGHINFEYEGRELTPRDATVEGVRRLREWIAAVK